MGHEMLDLVAFFVALQTLVSFHWARAMLRRVVERRNGPLQPLQLDARHGLHSSDAVT